MLTHTPPAATAPLCGYVQITLAMALSRTRVIVLLHTKRGCSIIPNCAETLALICP